MTQSTIADELKRHVAAVIHPLQAGYLPAPGRPLPTSASSAALARLRRADAADVAGSLEVWPITLAGSPDRLLSDRSTASPAERAAHAAICLYAVHQQSNRTFGVHSAGRSVGHAVRDLIASRNSTIADDDGVRLRFQRVALHPEHRQRVRHLRSLITLLRSKSIALDYGALARDLYLLDRPSAADSVRLRWGRDLYRAPSSAEPGSPTGDAQASEPVTT